MKVEEVVKKLKAEQLLDQNEIYTYATKPVMGGILGGAVGAAAGAVLLSVSGNILYVHKAKLDNTYGECLDRIDIQSMRDVQGKTGVVGGKLSFEYDGKRFKSKITSRDSRFIDYFINL
ncbi:hypothetical protein M2145_002938 [Lachnospiraceae bacterium PF1-21]|uniref:YokE-like PH domain-containing protein n=1 Tax=Ohessyouella blattaphilus TaxID=2949333 RepID=A0ABT1ELP7_9FIRM|nr:hypothetical protein [Ohessyouella blattaphilus]MCP1111630.1 hypothetical protein [Ohessyouella blattaphilus]MCR8565024.1 hypothetical protein [Ohessyouella blattaphilus]